MTLETIPRPSDLESGSSHERTAEERLEEATETIDGVAAALQEAHPEWRAEEVATGTDAAVAEIIEDTYSNPDAHEHVIDAGLVGIIEELSSPGGMVPEALAKDPGVFTAAIEIAAGTGLDPADLQRIISDVTAHEIPGYMAGQVSGAAVDDLRDTYGLTGELSYADTLQSLDEQREQFHKMEETFRVPDDNEDDIAAQQEFIRQVRSSEAIECALALVEEGIDPVDVMRNGPSMIDGLLALKRQGQAGEAAYGMAMKLVRCEGLTFIDENSVLFSKLTEDPESCRARIDMITAGWQDVKDSGCPVDVASRNLRGVFDKYSYQNRTDFDMTAEEELNARCERILTAIHILGNRGYEAKKRRPNGANDGYIATLAYEMHQGIAFDEARITDVRAKLDAFVAAFDEAIAASPVTVEMSGRSDFGDMGIDNLGDFAQALSAVAAREYKLRALSGDSEESLHYSVFSALRSSYDSITQNRHEGTEVDSAEVARSIDVAYDFHQTEPRYPKSVTDSLLRSTGQSAEASAARLLNPNVVKHLDDDHDREEIVRAAFLIERGDGDIDALLDVYDDTKGQLNGMLVEMMKAVPQEKDSGQSEKAYLDLLRAEMKKVDKNGTPYSSPQSVADTVYYMKHATAVEQAQLAWYRQDTLPLAAYRAVTSARERARAAGVADVPTAIYDYFGTDKEFMRELSGENLEGYIQGELLAPRGYSNDKTMQHWAKGKDTALLIEHAKRQAVERAGAFRVFINIGAEPLIKAANQGGMLKSIMDTDVVDYEGMSERGVQYVFHRSEVELMMGNRSRGVSEHPIYGSCGYVDRGVPMGAYGYGEIMLSVRPDAGDLRDRMTFTPEDSFHGTHRLTQEDAAALRIIKNAAAMDHTHTAGYIESQIVGGVDLSLLDAIYAPNQHVADELRSKLPPELASKVQIRTTQYDNGQEQADFRERFNTAHGGGDYDIQPTPPEPQEELVAHVPSAPVAPGEHEWLF